MKAKLLSIENLRLSYRTREGDVPAVGGVSFSLSKGETCGILGESGCGKTSLAFSLLRILPENAVIEGGRIAFKGRDILKFTEEEMRGLRWTEISMVFQAAMNALNPVYTVEYQIAEAMRAHNSRISRSGITDKILELFKMTGLPPEVMRKYPHQLSGGMKQRAVIAMALSCEPDLVIADEPTTALDVIVQDRILRNLKDIQGKLDTAMIYISHDISVLAEVSDRLAVMYAGKIVEEAPVKDIFKNPLHPYTRGLINAFPSIKGEKKKLSAVGGEPPDMITLPPGCSFRPRCPRAGDICREQEPPYKKFSENRRAACFRPMEQ